MLPSKLADQSLVQLIVPFAIIGCLLFALCPCCRYRLGFGGSVPIRRRTPTIAHVQRRTRVERKIRDARKDGLSAEMQEQLMAVLDQYEETQDLKAMIAEDIETSSLYCGRQCARSRLCCWLTVPLPLFERRLVRPLGNTWVAWWVSLALRTAATAFYLTLATFVVALAFAFTNVLASSMDGQTSIVEIWQHQLEEMRARRVAHAMSSEM